MKLHRFAQSQRKSAIQANFPPFVRATRQQTNRRFLATVASHPQHITARRTAANFQSLPAPGQAVSDCTPRYRQIGIRIVELLQRRATPTAEEDLAALIKARAAGEER